MSNSIMLSTMDLQKLFGFGRAFKEMGAVPQAQLRTLETTPAPTVLPPSLRANLCPANNTALHFWQEKKHPNPWM